MRMFAQVTFAVFTAAVLALLFTALTAPAARLQSVAPECEPWWVGPRTCTTINKTRAARKAVGADQVNREGKGDFLGRPQPAEAKPAPKYYFGPLKGVLL